MKPVVVVVVVDRIIETASRLFFAQGYNLTGINQILAESRVAKPSMYVHFRWKKEVLLAYLDALHGKWFGGLEDFTKSYTDPKERLIAIFDYRIDRQIKSDFGGCGWTKISAEISKDDKEGILKGSFVLKKSLRNAYLTLFSRQKGVKTAFLRTSYLLKIFSFSLEGAQVMACVSKTPQALIDLKEIIKNFL